MCSSWARLVRNRTTGVLYVLDEPSIGLHPANVDGLLGVMRDLVADGNSVVVVDHDTRVLASVDYLVEMGPMAGAEGGHVITQGSVADVVTAPGSRIALFLRDGGKIHERVRPTIDLDAMFAKGRIHLETNTVHTASVIGRCSARPAHCGHRRVGFRKDDDGIGDTGPRVAFVHRRSRVARFGPFD